MYTHPYVAHEIARQREDELRRSAKPYGQPGPRGKQSRGSARHRAGWVLIETGLYLVGRGSRPRQA